MRKKLSTTVYLTPEQDRRLKFQNERTKVPVAEYIRQGIEMVLAHYNVPSADAVLALEEQGGVSE